MLDNKGEVRTLVGREGGQMGLDPSVCGEGEKKGKKQVELASWLANLAKNKKIGRFLVPAHITRLPCGCTQPIDFLKEFQEGRLKTKFAILRALRRSIDQKPLEVVRCWHEHPFRCGICQEVLV